MKIVITGHTFNLGQAIYQHFSKKHDVIGLSRSNGFSIPEQNNKIVELAKKSDLFINNAHVDVYQSYFIKELYKFTDIITCGSMGADYYHLDKSYYKQKYYIEQTHKEIKKINNKKMLLLKMGYLENSSNQLNTIRYQEIINAIEFWLQNSRISMIEFENDMSVYTSR